MTPGHSAARSIPGRRIALSLLGAVLFSAACDAPTAPARTAGYPFALPGPDLVFHWNPGERVRVYLSPEPADRAAALSDAFDIAVASWRPAAPLGEVVIERAASTAVADVVLAWADGPFPVGVADCLPSGGSPGVTTFCLADGDTRFARYPLPGGAASDVIFLVTISPTLANDATTMGRLVTHEVGHVLGLFQHSPNPGDVMFGGEIATAVPTEADRASLFTLYHTPRDLRP